MRPADPSTSGAQYVTLRRPEYVILTVCIRRISAILTTVTQPNARKVYGSDALDVEPDAVDCPDWIDGAHADRLRSHHGLRLSRPTVYGKHHYQIYYQTDRTLMLTCANPCCVERQRPWW